MSIVNNLLTGGILVGKICQAVSSVINVYEEVYEGEHLIVTGPISSGGVLFFRSNTGGVPAIYAYNPSISSTAAVSVQNEHDGNGVLYLIEPMSKILFAEPDSPKISPDTNVCTGLTTGSASGLGEKENLVTLTFKDLKLTDSVGVGAFVLKMTTGQLAIITAGIIATAISYFYFKSDKGAAATNKNVIHPNNKVDRGDNNEVKQCFSIDFAALGIDINHDIIEGQLTLSLSPAALIALKSNPSVKSKCLGLHAVEKKFFEAWQNKFLS